MSFKGKKNVYACDKCKKTIVTVDRDEGVTPFGIECKFGCKAFMQSRCYRVPQDLVPDYEWYAPGEDEKKTLTPGYTDHVKNGGLLIREIQK